MKALRPQHLPKMSEAPHTCQELEPLLSATPVVSQTLAFGCVIVMFGSIIHVYIGIIDYNISAAALCTGLLGWFLWRLLTREQEIATNRGRLHNHYTLGPEIGQGRYGVVLRATSKASNKHCAIKRTNGQQAAAEIEILRDIILDVGLDPNGPQIGRHPHIIGLFDVFGSDPLHMVLELAEGGSLSQMTARLSKR